MKTRRERNPATQMIIGLFVIGIGMLFCSITWAGSTSTCACTSCRPC
jgi:hypothetical protein